MSLQYLDTQSLNIECQNLTCSTINGNPVNPGGGENLSQTLTVGNDANNLSIENVGILNLQNSAPSTSSVDLKTIAGDSLVVVKGGSGVAGDVNCGNVNCLGVSFVDANGIVLNNQAGLDPTGASLNTLSVKNDIGGSAQLTVGSAQITYLGIEAPQNQIYFLQAPDSTAVGAPFGRLPVVFDFAGTPTTKYIQLFNA
jgi:hypothetical protein